MIGNRGLIGESEPWLIGDRRSDWGEGVLADWEQRERELYLPQHCKIKQQYNRGYDWGEGVLADWDRGPG